MTDVVQDYFKVSFVYMASFHSKLPFVRISLFKVYDARIQHHLVVALVIVSSEKEPHRQTDFLLVMPLTENERSLSSYLRTTLPAILLSSFYELHE